MPGIGDDKAQESNSISAIEYSGQYSSYSVSYFLSLCDGLTSLSIDLSLLLPATCR